MTNRDKNIHHIQVNPRLHSPAKFVINQPRNSLSIHQRLSTRHSSVTATVRNGLSTATAGAIDQKRPSLPGTRAVGPIDLTQKYKMYQDSVIRSKPACLYRANHGFAEQ